MRQDYAGKTVWITGASSGLGEALAHSFAKRGARLVLSARREARLHEVAKACGASDVHVVPLDMTDFGAMPQHAQDVIKRVGPIDVMVHNAGVGQRASVLETSFEVERQMLETNYLGPVALTKAVLPSMLTQGSGSFVVISSVLGLMSVKHRAGYCASKHALHGYFNGLRAELSAQGIRVLLVCPGHIHSEFSLHALEADGKAHGVVDPGSSRGLTPTYCADKTLRALDRGEDEIYVTQWESAAVYANRYVPTLLRRVTSRLKAR